MSLAFFFLPVIEFTLVTHRKPPKTPLSFLTDAPALGVGMRTAYLCHF